jgi:hypothetical protein
MTTGRASWLLRRPEQTRTAFLELFFDLVFVLALFLLSQELLKHLSWTGVLQTLVLLLVWFFVVLLTDTFELRHPLIQLLVMSIMFCALVMAAAVPEAFGRQGLVFAGAYVTVRVGAAAAAVLLSRGHEAQRNALRLLFWFGITMAPWIVGACLRGWARAALWIVALLVEYAAVGCCQAAVLDPAHACRNGPFWTVRLRASSTHNPEGSSVAIDATQTSTLVTSALCMAIVFAALGAGTDLPPAPFTQAGGTCAARQDRPHDEALT